VPELAEFKVDLGHDPPMVAQTSRESLNELLGQCMPRLLRVADGVLHNHHDSEDALQDGLVLALRHFDQFKGQSQFSTWVYSIVRNSALSKLRKQRSRVTVSIDEPGPDKDSEWETPNLPADPGPNPERRCAQSEVSDLFACMLEGMPESHREIIRMCDLEGFSGKEAAQRLGLSVSAVKAQHHRARQAIRRSLISWEAGQSPRVIRCGRKLRQNRNAVLTTAGRAAKR